MKTQKLKLLFLTFLPLFYQCKKDPNTSNTNTNTSNIGYVKEYYTDKPVPNAEVAVYTDMNNLQLVEKVYSDSTGKFETNGSIYNMANVVVSKSGYFQYNFSNAQTNRDRSKNIFWLDMPAYIQTHIKNVNPVANDDYITIEGFPETTVPPFGSLVLQGKNVDTTVCCILAAGYKPFLIPVFMKKYPFVSDSAMPVICTPIANKIITVNIFY